MGRESFLVGIATTVTGIGCIPLLAVHHPDLQLLRLVARPPACRKWTWPVSCLAFLQGLRRIHLQGRPKWDALAILPFTAQYPLAVHLLPAAIFPGLISSTALSSYPRP